MFSRKIHYCFRAIFFLSLFPVLFLFFTNNALATNLNWKHVYGYAINVSTIRVSTSNPKIIYAAYSIPGDFGFGIVRSADSGETWSSVKSDLPQGHDINAISIYQKDDSVVAVSLWGSGVFLSENSGGSWRNIFPQSTTPRSIAISPNDKNIIFVGIGGSNDKSGVWKSINGGNSWIKMSSLDYGNNDQISIDPNNSSRIFASTNNLYRSDNNGIDWIKLPLTETQSLETVIDPTSPSVIFTGHFGSNEGVYKSTDNGDSWSFLSTGSLGRIIHLAVDKNGGLYVGRISNGGGLWRSVDKGVNWEDISGEISGRPGQKWGNVWGIAVSDKKIFVGVEYYGIYSADIISTEKLPVVFVPGFGASWSYKGLVENQHTNYSDWQLMPLFTGPYYGPLLQTLRNAGLEDNKTLFTFAYDFRQSVADSAVWLNSFLADKTSGVKANIVAHSMGGVVARYCFEKVAGCSDRINKIVTAGSPQTGTIKSYLLWEGGQIDEENVLMKTMEEIALHATNFPYLSDKDIVQNRFPGVRDLLPTFDYITGKPYVTMSGQGKNPLLTGMGPDSAEFLTALTTLSGNSLPTYSGFSTTERANLERALELWTDGKPGSFNNDIGDGTVLRSSSQMGGAENKEYAMNHTDYLRRPASLTDILSSFGLTAGAMATGTDEPTAVLAFVIHSPATISTTDGENINGQVIFITNPINDSYPVTITSLADGQFQLDSFWVKRGKPTVKKTFNVSAAAGSTQTINFILISQTFSDQNGDKLLASFRQKVRDAKMRNLGIIDAAVMRAAVDIKNNRRRQNAFADLEKAYTDCILLLSRESSGTSRSLLRETCEQISALAVKLSELFGQPTGVSQATADAARTATAVSQKLNKTSLTARDGANLALAQNFLNQANEFLSLGQNYPGRLSSLAAIYLLGR